jgi:hypothetical protein
MPAGKLECVNAWKLRSAALKAVEESVKCIDLTPLVQATPDERMDMVIGGVYFSVGSIYMVERIGPVIINPSALGKVLPELAGFSPRKFFRWPLV